MNENSKIPKATHEGELDINGIKLICYNLPTGERVLSRASVIKALGRTGKAKGGRQYDEGFKTPVFLTANNLKPFISSELDSNSKPIIFLDKGGQERIGYSAQLLPSICYVFIDANKAGAIKSKQKHIVDQCEKLVRGFATVGILALVDEATGYQYDREKDELQKILKLYVSDEILDWQKTFHNNFYKNIFRLKNWPYTANDIKKRPGVVGTYTNKFIYEQLPKGVLDRLKVKTPKSESGNYLYRLHQSLTPETGREHLRNQLVAVNTLMDVSHNWNEFLRLFQKKYGQLEINYDEVDRPQNDKKMVDNTKFNNELKGLLSVPKPEK